MSQVEQQMTNLDKSTEGFNTFSALIPDHSQTRGNLQPKTLGYLRPPNRPDAASESEPDSQAPIMDGR